MTLTFEEFRVALQSHLERENINASDLARRIGRPINTVGDWVRHGVKRERDRQRIIETYPHIFRIEATGKSTIPEQPIQSPDLGFSSILKTEMARMVIQNLSALLDWFLFEASKEERNHFRDQLGDDWKHLLELSRAMTSETAFDVTKQEGRLAWRQK
ncbi:MAG: hypothetical protein Q8P69_02105 [bacterium]|nr:hypothetical protein [bacterium]